MQTLPARPVPSPRCLRVLGVDPAVAACIKQQTAAIEQARDQGALPADAARRFLANVAQSCAAQVNVAR